MRTKKRIRKKRPKKKVTVPNMDKEANRKAQEEIDMRMYEKGVGG